jgi:hypothetical protein
VYNSKKSPVYTGPVVDSPAYRGCNAFSESITGTNVINVKKEVPFYAILFMECGT